MTVKRSYIQSGIKMETHRNFVFALSNQFVFDQPPAVRLIESDRTAVYDRLCQTFVARMFSNCSIAM